jgi:hypothetical protein
MNEFTLTVKNIYQNTFLLTGKINNTDIINNLIEFVKNNKDEKLSYKTNVKGYFSGFKSLVSNQYFIDFLKLIQPQIKIIYPDHFIIRDAWGNILKKNEEVTEHHHGDSSAFCGILYLTDGGPGTYFADYNLTVNEEIGKFVLFSPILKHSVKKTETDLERITIAFNMNQLKSWEKEKITWVNKNS